MSACKYCGNTAEYERGFRAGIAEAVKVADRKQFPILNSQGAKVDWQFVADHGQQARANHYQTVERLADRGGLSWCELHAVVHNRKYEKIDTNEAMIEVRALEARYLDAIRESARRLTTVPRS